MGHDLRDLIKMLNKCAKSGWCMAPHPDRTQDTGRHRPKKLPLGEKQSNAGNIRFYASTVIKSSTLPTNSFIRATTKSSWCISLKYSSPSRTEELFNELHSQRTCCKVSTHTFLAVLMPSMVFYSRYPSSDTKQETGVLRVHFMDIVLHGIVISYNKYTPYSALVLAETVEKSIKNPYVWNAFMPIKRDLFVEFARLTTHYTK